MPGRKTSPDGNLVLLGRIGAAQGLKGEIRIQSFTENPLDIAAYGPLTTGRGEKLEIETARLSKTMVIARLKGIGDRDMAEKLNGTELYVARGKLPAPRTGSEFYLADLIGLEARLVSGDVIGKVLAVGNYGAGNLIEVGENTANSEFFLFSDAIVPEVDIAGGYLVIAPPDEIIVEGEE